MFIGHYAPAFLAATLAPPRARVPLGIGFVATQLVDIAFFSFQVIGVEHLRLVPHITVMNPMDLYDMPWTHSLAGSIGWAAGFALILWLWRREWAMAAMGFALVLSHWLLDLLVHRPDLTLWGAPPPLGLGLWNHPMIEMPLELALAFGGLALFWARSRPRGASGRWAPVALMIAMGGLQAYNWLDPQPAQIVDPVPASIGLLGLFAYALLAALAAWTAHSRTVRA